jgi:hypothetical protein
MSKVLFLILCFLNAFLGLSAQELELDSMQNKLKITQKVNVMNTNKKTKLSPVGSVLFSSLFAGGGQYYNGEYLKGLIMTGVEIGGIALMVVSAPEEDGFISLPKNPKMFLGGLLMAFGASIWSMIDAGISAEKINKQNGFGFNFKINEHLDLTLKPEYNYCKEIGYNNTIYGAKVVLLFH